VFHPQNTLDLKDATLQVRSNVQSLFDHHKPSRAHRPVPGDQPV